MGVKLDQLKKKLKDSLADASNPITNFSKGLYSSVSETMKPLSQGLVSLDPYSRNMRAQADAQLLKARQITTAGIAKNPTPGLIRLATQQNTKPTAQGQYAQTLPTNRQVIGSGVKTAGLALSGGLGAGGLATTAAFTAPFAAVEAKKTGQPFTRVLGKQFGDVLPYAGIASKLSSPIISKLAPTSVIGSRIGQGGLNALESIGLDVATGNKVSAGNTALSFLTGVAGKPFQGNTNAKGFTLGKTGIEELAAIEDRFLNPQKFATDKDKLRIMKSMGLSKLDDNEYHKMIKEYAATEIDRLAAKYLPNEVLNTVSGYPKKVIKALVDLSSQNKLGNFKVGLAGDNQVKGGELPSSPKGNYKEKVAVPDLSSNAQLKMQSNSEISTPTKANQAVSLEPSIEKGQLNINRLNVKGAGKKVLQAQEAQVQPTVIGNKEVVAMARTAKGTSAMTDEQMKRLMAQQLKNRQAVVDLTRQYNEAKKSGASDIELGRIMLDMANQSRTARQGGTFAGRLLQAQNIVADQSASPMQKILALLDNAGVGEEKYLKDAVKVNWDNPAEVVSFYRKYVPPKFGEVLDEIRYSNMLSSPLTHITNVVSNAVQTGIVTPIEKTITGVLDMGKSLLTGSERKYYATAGIDYAGGYVRALPEAIKKAWGVLSGDVVSVRPDYENIPTGSTGIMKAYTLPLRALESMDQFFKTLVEGGVTNELQKGPQKLSGIKVADMAKKEADYRLFRQAFDPNGELGQGGVLKMFDKWNSAIANVRRLPGGKWILPFLQTPTNILKQGVEYSPLGFSTAIGAKNPTEQISKALIGTGVFMGAYQLAQGGLTSWEAPTSEKERELYYAAGMQPYSVKMGDKWVSFSKLGPLSYPLAMAAALASAEKNNPDKSKIENVGKSVSGMLGFFGDQSYVRSIGDLVDAIQGGVSIGASALQAEGANLAGQMIPYKSFLTWLGRMIDPTYRKASTFGERLSKDLPIIGSKLEPYTDINGNPSLRDFPILNSVSPYKVTQEKQPAAGLLEEYQTKKIEKAVGKRADEEFLAGDKEKQVSGNVYRYIDDNGAVKQIDLSFPMPEYKPTGNKTIDKELLSDYKGAITKQKNEIMKALEVGAITEEEAVKYLDKLNSSSEKGKKVSLGKSVKMQGIKISAPAKMPTVKFSKSSTSKLKLASTQRKTPKLKLKQLKKVKI
ncbi:MAG: hypothetical protein HY865_22620 [Chloroflexi bacterium]|nr:hypothetical protein [Chloroflexota bacterium]